MDFSNFNFENCSAHEIIAVSAMISIYIAEHVSIDLQLRIASILSAISNDLFVSAAERKRFADLGDTGIDEIEEI